MQDAPSKYEADVCLIVEGCYPYIRGGVSSWLDWLMRSQPDLTFCVVAIVPTRQEREPVYEFPPNMTGFEVLCLHEHDVVANRGPSRSELSGLLVEPLVDLFERGGLEEFSRLNGLINDPVEPVLLAELMNSRLGWDVLTQMYERTMPQASFFHYFWAWRALFGGMFSVMKFPLPVARVYHTISTGYAGLLAARAKLETGRPALITEHGIYTNERSIEILMAEWIADTSDKGLSLDDDRYDLRDMWTRAFEAYAATCYQACSQILTLYEDNQRLQRAHGAREDKLKVIANGIDYERFCHLARAGRDDRPTIALIGRVVPIKDVKTFITGAHIARSRIADLRVLVLGPVEEDPEYFEECEALVEELGMGDCLEFTGSVQITDYLPGIHVVVLSSLSEAQPLVLLEAGAAGIPCVTTDVGSCREILEGRLGEEPRLGPGGIVSELVAPEQIGEAVCELLLDEDKRVRFGENLKARVKAYYVTELASAAYRDLYQRYCDEGDIEQAGMV